MELKIILEVIQAVGAIGTAVGVLFAWHALRQTKEQSLTEFEDEFPREYRQLSQELPIKALLGEELTDSEHMKSMRAFFHYFDLCNEEVFMRQNRRVSEPTWLNWRGGIRSNLRLPAFKRAWSEINGKIGSFAELKKLEESKFEDDPVNWGPTHLEETSVPARGNHWLGNGNLKPESFNSGRDVHAPGEAGRVASPLDNYASAPNLGTTAAPQ